MNFNPNTMMKKQVERMISQRFGSVDNMMNDMSKFAGNRCCAQVTACGVRTRTKYATRVATSATGGVFKMLGNPACSPSNNLTAINGTAPTADTPVTQAVRKGAL